MDGTERGLAAAEEAHRARVAVALALAHHPWRSGASDEDVEEELATLGLPPPARRQALARLARDDAVYRGRDGWRLRAPPPTGRTLSAVGDFRFRR